MTVISNIKHLLEVQVTAPVQWLKIMAFCQAQGENVVSFGPGHVLSGLFRKEYPQCSIQYVVSTATAFLICTY
jgi:malonyl CoA-acyl carrier protein transacylase